MASPIVVQTHTVLRQLVEVLLQLDSSEYTKPLAQLSGSSVGQHVRHVVEFYQCLLQGVDSATVNYDQRLRDKTIEENRAFAIQHINHILDDLENVDLKKKITLEVTYDEPLTLPTSFERELVYNIEHSIHHMALIKIGVRELDSSILLAPEFGVAASTLKYQQQNVHRNVFTKE